MSVVEYNDSLVNIVKECTDSTQELFKDFNLDDANIDSSVESAWGNIALTVKELNKNLNDNFDGLYRALIKYSDLQRASQEDALQSSAQMMDVLADVQLSLGLDGANTPNMDAMSPSRSRGGN